MLTAVGALLVGFLLVAGLSAGRTAALVQDARKAELVALIDARQGRTEVLQTQLEDLRKRVAEAEAEASAGIPVLRQQVSDLEAFAGLTALRGPGVRVVASDASGNCPTGRTEDCRIQDTDLQLIANVLWAAGAEGVAINGQRLIATTAIRSAGRAVLVNYRVLTNPYMVEAIGDPVDLLEGVTRSELASDFAAWRDVYGLGFSVEVHDELTVSAFTGSVRLPTSQVLESP